MNISVVRKTINFFIVWNAAELHERQLSEIGLNMKISKVTSYV